MSKIDSIELFDTVRQIIKSCGGNSSGSYESETKSGKYTMRIKLYQTEIESNFIHCCDVKFKSMIPEFLYSSISSIKDELYFNIHVRY